LGFGDAEQVQGIGVIGLVSQDFGVKLGSTRWVSATVQCHGALQSIQRNFIDHINLVV